MDARRLLTKLASPFGYHSGHFQRRWKRSARASGLGVVLCYHRVVDCSERRKAGLTVDEGITAATFEAQIRFMLSHFQPIQASDALQGEPDGHPRFAVTFDDGYADNHDVAAPILRRLGVPATFYVVSRYVGTARRFWWDRLAALVRNTSATELVLNAAGAPGRLSLSGPAARIAATDRLGAWLRGLPQPAVEAALADLAYRLGCEDQPLPSDRLMDWPQLRALAAQGFEIGSHTADHLNLAHLDGPALQDQVIASKAEIEVQTGQPVLSLAYPYGGAQHFGAAAREAVHRAGYLGAYSAIGGVATRAADRFAVPRLVLNWPHAFACAYSVDQAVRTARRL